jgi:hypothetical protein
LRITTCRRQPWLEIDPTTGELRNRPGQVPQQVVSEGRIAVTVRDRSEAGAGQSTTRVFDLDVDECDADVTCYQSQGDACFQGVQACDAEDIRPAFRDGRDGHAAGIAISPLPQRRWNIWAIWRWGRVGVGENIGTLAATCGGHHETTATNIRRAFRDGCDGHAGGIPKRLRFPQPRL